MTSIVPPGSVLCGVQLPIQTLTRTLREPWELDATVQDLARVAETAEAAGFGFLGACDHVALPLDDYTRRMGPTWYDPIATLSYVAARTSRIRLLSAVYIAAYRHPLVAAKSFATLDHLSGGRVIVGVGVGHVATEFDALGVDFSTRGARTDESIDAMRAAFASEYSSHAGAFYRYDAMGVSPRPAQPQVPIWVGGSSRPALRRVAERGDGWIPQGTPRAQMRSCIDYIRARRDEVRPGAELDLGFFGEAIYIGTPPWDVGPDRLTGSPERIAASLREGPALGCRVLHVHMLSRSCDELCDQLSAFGRDVAPLLTD